MQWLIDIIAERVINTIGIPPTFIDRGDPAAADFLIENLTRDYSWYLLDLSTIVPAGATAVTLHVIVESLLAYNALHFRRRGNTQISNMATIFTQVAEIAFADCIIVPCNANRQIEYKISPGIESGTIVIAGWWL